MIRLAFTVAVTFLSTLGLGLAMNAIAAWVFPEPLCPQCRRLPSAHVRRLRRAPRLALPGDRVRTRQIEPRAISSARSWNPPR
jgi:hypothetical protein